MSYNTVGIIKNGVKQKLPVVMVAPKVDGPDYVEVVADGVKTYSALLDSLFSLIDVARITSKSKLFETDTYVNISYSVQMWTSSLLRVCMAYHSATKWVSQNLELKASGSTFLRFEDSTSTDYSSQVVNTGVVLRFYYDTATLDLTTRASNCVYDNSNSGLSATNAQAAIDEVVSGTVLATVTADGVKTWSELLQELGTNNVFNNVTYRSKLVLVSGTTKLIYQVRMIDSATIDFYAANIETASYFDSMKVKLGNAGVYKNMAISSSGVITFNDYGGYAGTSGATLTIYK